MTEETVYFAFSGRWTAELYRRALKARLRKVRWLYGVLSALLIVNGFLEIGNGWDITFGTFSMLIGLFLLAFPSLIIALNVSQFRKTNRYQQDRPYTILFTDTVLVAQTEFGEARVPYELIYRVLDTQDMIQIMLSSNQMYVLEKQNITVGDPNGFFPFLCTVKRVPYKKG